MQKQQYRTEEINHMKLSFQSSLVSQQIETSLLSWIKIKRSSDYIIDPLAATVAIVLQIFYTSYPFG